jgi:hypothetical protein
MATTIEIYRNAGITKQMFELTSQINCARGKGKNHIYLLEGSIYSEVLKEFRNVYTVVACRARIPTQDVEHITGFRIEF